MAFPGKNVRIRYIFLTRLLFTHNNYEPKLTFYSSNSLQSSTSTQQRQRFDSWNSVINFFWFIFVLTATPTCSFILYSDVYSCVLPLRLEVQCEVVDSEINHILPAFSVMRRECSLQREPLLFSCAGQSPKYRRLCPCRDFLQGQVALCRDCL